MNAILAGVALAVAAGAVIAVSAREARAAMIGLTVALGLGPLLADPLPEPAVLGARVVAGLLAVYVLRAAAGDDEPGLGSRIGWPAETVLALGGALTGLAIATGLAGLASGPAGPAGGSGNPLDTLTPSALGLAAGIASMVVGLAPAFLARSGLRASIGLLVLAQGVILTRIGAAGPPGGLEQVGIAGLVLALGIAGAVISSLDRRAAHVASAVTPQ